MDALTAAGDDPRVQGLAASIGADTTFDGLAQVQELRNAVNLFRQALNLQDYVSTPSFASQCLFQFCLQCGKIRESGTAIILNFDFKMW